ncbi:MAG TPA: UDP-N-acetylglucosamine acyltransferase [Verrucomicrobiae bacterium]|nr:UDP-N-acetylglucosamine acyltransferase [Verrucomicrobiae bacterium]
MNFRFPGMREAGGNLLHESAVVGPDVRLGKGNFVGPFSAIVGNVEIGDDNWIGPHVTIGTAPQYHGPRFEWKESGFLPIRIGHRNTLREYVSVNEPRDGVTLIEDDCYLMGGNFVAHDVALRSRVTLSAGVQLSGFTEIQYGCVMGLSSTVHQFTTIGAFSMIGMSSVVIRDLPPFSKWAGNPARFLGLNAVGLERNGFSREQIDAIASAQRGGGAYPDLALPHLERFTARNAQTARGVAPTERGSRS